MAVSLGNITQNASTGTPSFTHTCASGTVSLYVLIAAYETGGGTAGTVTGVTYNGVSMTQEESHEDSGGNTTCVFSLQNPPIGSADTVAATFSGNTPREYQTFAVDVIGAYSSGDPTDGGSANGSNFSTGTGYGPTTSYANSLALSIAWGVGGSVALTGSDTTQSTISTYFTCYLTTYQTTTAGNYDVFGISQSGSSSIGAASVGIRVGGNSYNQSLSDTLSLSESFSKAPGKSLLETVALAEVFIKSLARAWTETFSLSDAISTLKTKGASLTDTFSLVEKFIKATSRTLTDTFSLSEAFNAGRSRVKAVSDTIGLTEVFSKAHTWALKLIDTFSFGEIISKVKNGIPISNVQWAARTRGVATWVARIRGSTTWTKRNKP